VAVRVSVEVEPLIIIKVPLGNSLSHVPTMGHPRGCEGHSILIKLWWEVLLALEVLFLLERIGKHGGIAVDRVGLILLVDHRLLDAR